MDKSINKLKKLLLKNMDKRVLVLSTIGIGLNEIQNNLYKRAKDNLNKKTYECNSLDEVKDIMENHPGFVNAYWCGNEECENKMKEINGTKSRCIIESKDYKDEKCIVCGENAKHKVVWGIQY